MTSIIIPCDNKFIEVKELVKTIHANTDDYELIFVTSYDNPCRLELEKWGQVISTTEKFIFSHRVNLGFKKATGDYLVLLNQDTKVEPHWLEYAIQDDKKLGPGLVGFRCQRGGGANYDAHGEGPALYTNSTLNMYGIMLSRRGYEMLGDLDERFIYYGGEDDDYSLRALRHGLKLIVTRGKLFHAVGSHFDPGTVKNLLPKTRTLFKKKWNVNLPVPPGENWADIERQPLTQPLVSVVIPTRGHHKYLPDCISSILQQTYPNLQIIVGVDGKDQPEVFEILQDISRVLRMDKKLYWVLPNVSRLLVLKTNEPVGSCNMRNRCVPYAYGELIALQDSDDEMLPDRIRNTIKYFQDPTVDIVYSDFILRDKTGDKVCTRSEVTKQKLIDRSMDIPGGTFMMRKRCLKKEPFYEKYCRAFDFEYALRTLDKFKYVYHAEPTIIYNRHDGEHLSGNNESHQMHKELIKEYRR